LTREIIGTEKEVGVVEVIKIEKNNVPG